MMEVCSAEICVSRPGIQVELGSTRMLEGLNIGYFLTWLVPDAGVYVYARNRTGRGRITISSFKGAL